MAKLIILEGANININGYSVVKSGNEIHLRRTGTISKKRYASDPVFSRMRENSAEFGRASKAAGLIKSILRPMLTKTKLTKVHARLSKVLLRIIKADELHIDGHRQLLPGNMNMLCNFQFNENRSLQEAARYQVQINASKETGLVTTVVQLPDCVNHIHAPEDATHFELSVISLTANFNNNQWDARHTSSGQYPLTGQEPVEACFDHQLQHLPDNMILVAMGIHYYKHAGGGIHAVSPANTAISIIMAGTNNSN